MESTKKTLKTLRVHHIAATYFASLLPVVWDAPLPAAAAWAGVLIVGCAIAGKVPLYWVVVGWVGAIAVPGFPLGTAAAAGFMLGGTGTHPVAAVVGAALGIVTNVLPFPRPVHLGGALLIIAAAGSALAGRKTT